MASDRNSKVQLHGFCNKEYEPVKLHLERMLRKGTEDNVQLCVYVNNSCVIDLYGTATGNHTYNADTLQTVFSSGKSLETIVAAMLVDRGLLSYDAKVAQYWPEFGQKGKEEIRIYDVLRHESGLAWFKEAIPKRDYILPENIKANLIGAHIEKEEPHYPGLSGKAKVDTKREYHAFTRGLIMNEIIRRVDPNGRTIGDILREDIGIEGVFLGLKDEELKRTAQESLPTSNYVLMHSLLPKWAGKRLDITFTELYATIQAYKGMNQSVTAPFFFADWKDKSFAEPFVELYNSEVIRKGELCSAGSQCNARGLGKLAAIMANKGQPLGDQEENKPLMSEDTWAEMHSEPTVAYDGCFPDMRTNFTKGGLNYFVICDNPTEIEKNNLVKNREGFYGWFGFGGSIFQWNPELKIGFAFAPTKLHNFTLCNDRGAVLQQLVKNCLKK